MKGDPGYFGPDSMMWKVNKEITVLFGGARALSSMRGGGDEFDDMFEEETVVPGPLELQCPSCGGLISITTTQRPIQVGCPMCQAQFVIRE